MSLDWSLADAKPELKEEILRTDDGWAVTQSVIFEAMLVEMNGITEKNWMEFYVRSCLVRHVIGAEPFTPDDIRKRIGLKTNVTTKSRTSFMASLYQRQETRCKSLTRVADADKSNGGTEP